MRELDKTLKSSLRDLFEMFVCYDKEKIQLFVSSVRAGESREIGGVKQAGKQTMRQALCYPWS